MVTDVTGPVAASARRPGSFRGYPILAAKITAPAVPDWAVPRPRITKLIAREREAVAADHRHRPARRGQNDRPGAVGSGRIRDRCLDLPG